MVQLEPAATELPQLSVSAKTEVPVAMELKFIAALPVFDNVTCCGALVVPIFCAWNVTRVGLKFSTGAAGVEYETGIDAVDTVPLGLVAVMVSRSELLVLVLGACRLKM